MKTDVSLSLIIFSTRHFVPRRISPRTSKSEIDDGQNSETNDWKTNWPNSFVLLTVFTSRWWFNCVQHKSRLSVVIRSAFLRRQNKGAHVDFHSCVISLIRSSLDERFPSFIRKIDRFLFPLLFDMKTVRSTINISVKLVELGSNRFFSSSLIGSAKVQDHKQNSSIDVNSPRFTQHSSLVEHSTFCSNNSEVNSTKFVRKETD